MSIKAFLFLAQFFILSAVFAHAQTTAIEPGNTVEREIAGGESHTYRITLQSGQFMRVIVEQKSIDVALALIAPDGKQIVEVNLARAGVAESLSEEATRSGDYRLTVRGISPVNPTGTYLLRLDAREPTEQDKQRIAAERLLVEVDKLSPRGERVEAFQQMLEKLQQALGLWRELKDRYWEADTLNKFGVIYYRLGRLDQAVDYLEQSLAIRRELKDRVAEGVLLNNLGAANYGLSRFEKASEFYERALAIRREAKDRAGEGVTLGNLAVIYLALSRYDKAIEYYERALAINRETKDRSPEGNTLTNLGNTYKVLGRYDKAIEFHEQALIIKREVKDRQGEGRVLINLGGAYVGLSSYDKAIEYYEQALAINREAKDRVGEAGTLYSLGGAYGSLGRHEKAGEYHEQALIIRREVKDRAGEGLGLSGLGDTYRALGRYEKAIECLKQALAIARELKNRDNEASALYNFSKVEHDRGDLTRARTLIEEGLKVAESLRSEIYNQASRVAYFASMQKYNEFHIGLLMRLHREDPTGGFDALAIEASERARARGLLELLTEAGANIRQGVDAPLLERERLLAKQLNVKAASQMQLLGRPHTPEQSAAVREEISQLESDYEQAQAAIRRTSPRYAALTQPQPLKLKEIQAQLDADTLLLEYSLGEERSYLWAISRDSLNSYELPKGNLIKQNALQVYEMLTARNSGKASETASQRKLRVADAEAKLPAAAAELGRILLGPVAGRLGTKRLVIVADGALQYIPFASLPDPAAATSQPLIVDHEVVSLPSASALAIQRTELAGRQPASKMLAVIADPVFDRTDARLKTTATDTSDSVQSSSSTDTRGLEHIAEASDGKTGRLVIRRLPFTRQEVDGLLALTPKDSSWRAMDFQASRANVLSSDLSQYRYVHFATHGLLDTERPGLSSLVLSTVDADGKPQDGFLRANDIYNMKLPAELVVLSACQTGLGKEVKGEGLIGLTRGFMYAGARRVVVSLWSVNDRATADLMTKFYRGMLKDNDRPAAALRSAQIEMWKQRQWKSPYYWAAFTMQGEWR